MIFLLNDGMNWWLHFIFILSFSLPLKKIKKVNTLCKHYLSTNCLRWNFFLSFISESYQWNAHNCECYWIIFLFCIINTMISILVYRQRQKYRRKKKKFTENWALLDLFFRILYVLMHSLFFLLLYRDVYFMMECIPQSIDDFCALGEIYQPIQSKAITNYNMVSKFVFTFIHMEWMRITSKCIFKFQIE